MYKDLKFPVLIVHRDIKADTVAGDRVRGIARSWNRRASVFFCGGLRRGAAGGRDPSRSGVHVDRRRRRRENTHLLQNMVELIRLARRAPNLPIFALGEQVTLENAPADAMSELNQLRGILYLFEDTVPFLARQVARAARTYLDGLLPPFFKALVQHTADSNYSWHTPAMAVAWPIEKPGGAGVSSVLWGEHPALGLVGIGARTGLAARSHRAFGRSRGPLRVTSAPTIRSS